MKSGYPALSIMATPLCTTSFAISQSLSYSIIPLPETDVYSWTLQNKMKDVVEAGTQFIEP